MSSLMNKFHSFLSKLHTLKVPRKLKHKLLLCGCILMLLTLMLVFYRYRTASTASEQFRTLSGEIAAYELQRNGLNLHYTLSDCSSYGMHAQYGLDASNALLPVFSVKSMQEEADAYRHFFDLLGSIDKDDLSAHEQSVYDSLYASLSHTCTALQYPYFDEPLSPSSGEQNSVLVLLAAYSFRSEEDVIHYLALLRSLPDYFEGLLAYEQQKADAGLFMSDAAADKLIAQCDHLCTEKSLSEHSHFLQTTFEARISALVANGTLCADQADAYIAQNDDILLHQVSPAYTTLADGIFLLKGSGHNEYGLCFYESGADYYRNLLSSVTGSDKSPAELLQLLKDSFSADYLLLCEIADQLSSMPSVTEAPSPVLAFSSPEEMLADLQKRMKADFPILDADVDFTVNAVDAALSPYVSPTFYLIPPVDDYTQNHISVNYKDQPDSLTLYTTLAHEGYPGHLYQTVYHLSALDADSILPLEGMLSCGGFVEGYATYVEDLSYEYAAQVLAEQSGYSEETAGLITDFYRIDRRLKLCLFSMLDISIHYSGMTKPEAVSLLNAYGITDPDVISGLYEYIVEEPACYPKYFIGYLEIMALKEAAGKILGDSYSDLAFHTFLLNAGPAPFSIITEKLQHTDALAPSSMSEKRLSSTRISDYFLS